MEKMITIAYSEYLALEAIKEQVDKIRKSMMVSDSTSPRDFGLRKELIIQDGNVFLDLFQIPKREFIESTNRIARIEINMPKDGRL